MENWGLKGETFSVFRFMSLKERDILEERVREGVLKNVRPLSYIFNGEEEEACWWEGGQRERAYMTLELLLCAELRNIHSTGESEGKG